MWIVLLSDHNKRFDQFRGTFLKTHISSRIIQLEFILRETLVLLKRINTCYMRFSLNLENLKYVQCCNRSKLHSYLEHIESNLSFPDCIIITRFELFLPAFCNLITWISWEYANITFIVLKKLWLKCVFLTRSGLWFHCQNLWKTSVIKSFLA